MDFDWGRGQDRMKENVYLLVREFNGTQHRNFDAVCMMLRYLIACFFIVILLHRMSPLLWPLYFLMRIPICSSIFGTFVIYLCERNMDGDYKVL
jgi:hypothetical protein